MLTEKQLRDIHNCEKIKCKECSFSEQCDCGAKSKVAETALILVNILKTELSNEKFEEVFES